jgi:hypothetical protein
MRYMNLRPIVDKHRTEEINQVIKPICDQHKGVVELLVKGFLFELGESPSTCQNVSKHKYVAELNKREYCRNLVEKELADIELFEDSVHFHLVDFPKGGFKKCHNKIFDAIRDAGYKKIILDDYTRAGFDIWSKYGFTGGYLSNSRVKYLS